MKKKFFLLLNLSLDTVILSFFLCLSAWFLLVGQSLLKIDRNEEIKHPFALGFLMYLKQDL